MNFLNDSASYCILVITEEVKEQLEERKEAIMKAFGNYGFLGVCSLMLTAIEKMAN